MMHFLRPECRYYPLYSAPAPATWCPWSGPTPPASPSPASPGTSPGWWSGFVTRTRGRVCRWARGCHVFVTCDDCVTWQVFSSKQSERLLGPRLGRPVFSAAAPGQFLLRLPVRDGLQGRFLQVARVTEDTGVMESLSLGTFTVRRILGWDAARSSVWVSFLLASSSTVQRVW